MHYGFWKQYWGMCYSRIKGCLESIQFLNNFPPIPPIFVLQFTIICRCHQLRHWSRRKSSVEWALQSSHLTSTQSPHPPLPPVAQKRERQQINRVGVPPVHAVCASFAAIWSVQFHWRRWAWNPTGKAAMMRGSMLPEELSMFNVFLPFCTFQFQQFAHKDCISFRPLFILYFYAGSMKIKCDSLFAHSHSNCILLPISFRLAANASAIGQFTERHTKKGRGLLASSLCKLHDGQLAPTGATKIGSAVGKLSPGQRGCGARRTQMGKKLAGNWGQAVNRRHPLLRLCLCFPAFCELQTVLLAVYANPNAKLNSRPTTSANHKKHQTPGECKAKNPNSSTAVGRHQRLSLPTTVPSSTSTGSAATADWQQPMWRNYAAGTFTAKR